MLLFYGFRLKLFLNSIGPRIEPCGFLWNTTGDFFKREPWVTNGILTSSPTKSKLLKKKLKTPTEQNINAFKKYCIIFDKVKKMAKESYFNLELNKNNLKKT